MNPFQALLKSRKFLVLLMDITVSLVLYFSAKYLAGGAVEDIKTAIVALKKVLHPSLRAWRSNGTECLADMVDFAQCGLT